MADPLLTTLCTICYALPPKYKCPRCGTRTCSLSCNRKHKKWRSCTGERDPTVYFPPKALRTPAGIDHDYNFLAKIERARERSEKLIVDDKKLLELDDLRPVTFQELRYKPGPDGRSKRYLVTRVLRRHRTHRDTRIHHRTRSLGINVIFAPPAFSRHDINGTSWNRPTARINWQVEWIIFGDQTRRGDGDGTVAPQTILSKALDDVPIFQAFVDSHKDRSGPRWGQEERVGRSQLGGSTQDRESSIWKPRKWPLQDTRTGMWITVGGSRAPDSLVEVEETCKREFRFFLARPLSKPPVLIPVDLSSKLGEALRNRTVLEFPTFYVFGAAVPIPNEFQVQPGKNVPSTFPNPAGRKRRKQMSEATEETSKRARRHLEEGEILEDGQCRDERNHVGTDGRLDDEVSNGSQGDLESEGEVENEMSFGEDGDETDTTSSEDPDESDE